MSHRASADRFTERGARPVDISSTGAKMEQRALIDRGPSSPAAVDAFRELSMRLLAISQGPLVVLVAPVTAGSGASHVARNLAITIAFEEQNAAVLVDCDLRQPSQQAAFRIEPVHGGLIDYLEDGQRGADNLLHDSGVPGLRLLPAGVPRDINAECSRTPRMRQLVDALREVHPDCHVILDAPPVRGGRDARNLAALADVVVLVAGHGRDTPAAIAQAAANFDPGKFAGVVFNEGV